MKLLTFTAHPVNKINNLRNIPTTRLLLYGRVALMNENNYNKNGGPRSFAGKAISSKNAQKHGLTGKQIVMPGEDPAAFEALVSDFEKDYQPQTAVEAILVHDLAKYHWLKQRAIRLSQQAFLTDLALDPKHLELMIRYQGANDRAFRATLRALDDAQKARLKREKESVSQVVYVPGFPTYDKDGNVVPDGKETTSEAKNHTHPPGKVA